VAHVRDPVRAFYKKSRTTGGDIRVMIERDSVPRFRTTLAWDKELRSSYASCQSSRFIV